MRAAVAWLSSVWCVRGWSMPVARVGVVADVQHADKEDGGSDGRRQFYRAAPGKLASAVDAFNEAGVDCVVTLGDAIDGNVDEASTYGDLERVATQFDRLTMPAHHVLGNHCLSVPRESFLARVGMPASYYSAAIAPSWLLVVLDTNDLAVHGWPEDHPNRQLAERYLDSHRGPQMVRWNGGVGDEQLDWLARTLDAADAAGDAVIVAAHHPLFDAAARPSHCAWNWETLADLLVRRPCVKLVLAGHDHVGGYAAKDGLHFLTLQAILEAPEDAYATIHLFPDRLEIHGRGTVTSRVLLARDSSSC